MGILEVLGAALLLHSLLRPSAVGAARGVMGDNLERTRTGVSYAFTLRNGGRWSVGEASETEKEGSEPEWVENEDVVEWPRLHAPLGAEPELWAGLVGGVVLRLRTGMKGERSLNIGEAIGLREA